MASMTNMGRKSWLLTLALLFTPLVAYADVKSGVDAWERGEYAAAVAQWRPLAIAGDPDAQFNLAQAYKLGRGLPVDLAEAEAWFRRAADQGHLQAEDNLGLVLFTANKREAAMPYISRAAARGEPRAQYVLGTAHFNGDLASRDWALAYALTKRASDAGLQVASARLAQLDTLIPLEERQRGLAMLPELEKSEQRTRLAAITAPPAPAPKPAAARPAPPRVPAVPSPVADNWRAQLGAFGNEANARSLYSAIAKKHPGTRPYYVKAGAVTRLQAGNFAARADAEAFCAKVRTANQPCIVVAR
ncbi:MAG: SPOR domain-containing protein [Sphingopyxis sp.]|nr:SPOR domain-containing protein [Sphingopyxis sp.]